MTLVPAYGRDYKSKKEVLEAFNGNKDFIIADMFSPDSGRMCSKDDLNKGETVTIRYKQLRNCTVVTL